MKASLLLYFLLFLHLQHHFLHAISPSTTPLASADPNHDKLPVHSVEPKPDGDVSTGKTAELAIVVKKGGGGGGGRGGGGGGGGRSFGGGGRSFGGGGRGKGGGESGKGGKARGVVPFVGGAAGSHHRSSGGRESASVWLGLSTLLGLVLGF